jgi:hypothetical protein
VNWSTFSTRLLLGSALVAILPAVACSKAQDEPTFSTEDADVLALKMLPDPLVLPGTGWKLVSENEFGESEVESTAFLDSDGCGHVNDVLSTRATFDREERVGRAVREFEVGGVGEDPITVTITAQIYRSVGRLVPAARAFDELVWSGDFGACLVARSEVPRGDETVSVDATAEAPSASSPRGGSHFAVAANVHGAGGETVVYSESYTWRIGNAVLTVELEGTKERMTDQFVAEVLARVDGSALVAARG